MRRPSRLAFAIAGISLLCASWWAVSSPGRTPLDDAPLPVEALQADLEAWQSAILSRHPRWHDREDDPELAKAFEAIRTRIQGPMSRREAFRLFARINPALGDAHALLMPTSITPERGDSALFPFDVRVDSDRLVVRRSWRRVADGQAIDADASIISINGTPTAELLSDLDSIGHGETHELRRAMLGVLFGDWLHAVRGWSDRFSIAIDGASTTIEVGPGDEWVADIDDTERWTPRLARLEGNIAWLRLPTFDVDDDPEAFETAIDAIFASLHRDRIDGLVIDVRGNTGGQSDAGGHVARYLTEETIPPASRAVERLHDDNSGWLDWRGAPGTLRTIKVDGDTEIEPVDPSRRFGGRVVLLVDRMTYSAAIVFATTLQDHGLATLVGSATGGFGNQTGNMEPFVLPSTRLLAYIPAREFIRPNGDATLRPVIPDVVVATSGQVEDEALAIARRIAAGQGLSPAGP